MASSSIDGPSQPEDLRRRGVSSAAGSVVDGRSVTDGTLRWEYDMPLVNNLFVVRDCLTVIVLSLLLMQALLAVVGLFADGKPVLLPLEIWAWLFGILLVLFLIATLVVLWNRIHVRFTVDPQGVTCEIGPRERRLNRIAMFLGFIALLSGRPGLLGTSLLAQSQETVSINWRDVRKVRVYPRQRAISISNSWRTVCRLYCPPELYDRAVEMVQCYAAEGEQWRTRHPSPPRVIPWRFYLAWTVLAAIGTIVSGAWYLLFYDHTERLIIAAGLLVWLSGAFDGLWRKGIGLLAAAASAWLVVTVVLTGAEPLRGLYDLRMQARVGHTWELDTPYFALSMAGAALLLVMSAVRLFGRGPRQASRRSRKPA